jgi:hypothetical protein
MTANDRFDGQLQGWLQAEASTPAPANLHGSAIDRARRQRQRPGWLVGARRVALGEPSVAGAGTGRRLVYVLVATALAAAIVGTLIAAGAFRTPAPKLGRNGAIAYAVSDPAAGLHTGPSLRLVESDGTADRRIAFGTCPQFAAKASVLAYSSTTDDLIIDEIGSSGVVSTTTFAGLGRAGYALSPDGTRVAWFQHPTPEGDGPTPSELWVRDVAGGPAVRVLPAPEGTSELYSNPVWSPDGRQIAFARTYLVQVDTNTTAPFRYSIALVDADGSDLHELTNRAGDGAELSWSPDGRFVTFPGYPNADWYPTIGEPNPAQDIFVAAADGTHTWSLTRTAADESHPVWSPDGSRIAYLSTTEPQVLLSTVRVAGSQASAPPVLGPAVDNFAWSPDGMRLVYLAVTVVDSQAAGGSIATIDADLRTAPVTVQDLDFPVSATPIDCSPTWQRLDR